MNGYRAQQLLAFYGEEDGIASNGYSREQLLAWSDEDWEQEHDFIQWLFPLKDASNYNPDAPVLSESAILWFRSDPLLQQRLRQSFQRWLGFCGLGYVENHVVQMKPRPEVWDWPNHNWLRVTRVLKSLTLLGLQNEANDFHRFLYSMKERVGPETWGYWTDALHLVTTVALLFKYCPHSKRHIMLMDNGLTAVLYLHSTSPSEDQVRKVEATAFAFNRIEPIAKDEVERFRPYPPPIAADYASSDALCNNPEGSDWKIKISKSGNAVLLFRNEIPWTWTSIDVPWGMSKAVSTDGPWGKPWSEPVMNQEEWMEMGPNEE